MRLTLRTLLAWLDDTLSPGEVREIGKQVSESPFAQDMQARLAALRQDQTVAAGSYQAALLQVPAMGVMALWLRGSGGSSDILVPLAPSPSPLVAGRHYGTADFCGAGAGRR